MKQGVFSFTLVIVVKYCLFFLASKAYNLQTFPSTNQDVRSQRRLKESETGFSAHFFRVFLKPANKKKSELPEHICSEWSEDKGHKTTVVEWDGNKQTFKTKSRNEWTKKEVELFISRVFSMVKAIFLPQNVTQDYYQYSFWRGLHRFISATLSVFGTQALLSALGHKTKNLGAAAAANWLLKDTFGKLVRIFCAGRLGERFDTDSKKMRYKSSLLYTAGTGIEVITSFFPSMFLSLATLSNALKQISMLTFSATRNTFYRSFASKGENIGDITAKGEAQVAFIDIVGILAGIGLGKFLGNSKAKLVAAYFIFSVLEIFSIYKEIRAVVFRVLNQERAMVLIEHFVRAKFKDESLMSPESVASLETLFFPSKFSKGLQFSTLSQIDNSINEMSQLLNIFSQENFCIAFQRSAPVVLLHKRSTGEDILKSLFVLQCVKLKISQVRPTNYKDLLEIVEGAKKDFAAYFPRFLGLLKEKGWNDKVFLFKDIKTRNTWPR